ncbi:PBP1b-binding outer membrane lipoprotein LpoB [Alkalibacillus salilacus]|uniref:PBP1b-binding outer membrane lipoprotein LpoB n=1 Tax=Alkalibacillus salilacus TaxID=284582 RepID=A0ABT9VI30_9BACI|nr:PBP1b-binding outer membrane lipoprotein LpoB [Alkalibacillus salilacus]
MKSLNQYKIYGLFLMISVFLVGCSNSEDSIEVEGYVVEIEEDRIFSC